MIVRQPFAQSLKRVDRRRVGSSIAGQFVLRCTHSNTGIYHACQHHDDDPHQS